MAANSRVDLVCENPNRNGQRVSVNLSEQTVTFFNCHQLRSGPGVGFEPVRVCSFEEIVDVHDFLVGEHRGTFLRVLLIMGRLIHVNARAEDLASIFVSTATGRSRIFATWNGFPELRTCLKEISSKHSRLGHWADNPHMMPLFMIAMFAIVFGIIWLLL